MVTGGGAFMKKVKLILLILIVVLIFSGCCDKSTSRLKERKYPLSNITNDYKSGENFKVYANSDLTAVEYLIFDDEGRILDKGYHNLCGSFDIYKDNKLLVLKYGQVGNSWYSRYYDIATKRVSSFFDSPVANTDELVAYFLFNKKDNKIVLVIQNIFNSQIFYKEIIRDFSDFVIKNRTHAEFIDNNTKLKISYWIKPDNHQVEETIDIFEP